MSVCEARLIGSRMLIDSGMGESVVDFPRPGLSEDIWVKEGEEYALKEGVKEKIFEFLSAYPELDLPEIAEKIRIVGSMCTNQYEDVADVDIHVIPKKGALPENKNPEDWVKDVFRWYKVNRDEINGYIEKHPLEVYIQLNPFQDMMSDGVYDLLEEKWIKGPKLMEMGFDPYEVFSSILDDIRATVTGADKMIGELKRDVIDYYVIKRAVERLPAEEKEKLLNRLKDKLDEIEQDIDDLMVDKKKWLMMRKEASSPVTTEQALEDVEMAKVWGEKNAIFKFLNRYEYLRLISDLEKMMEDNKVDDRELEILKGVLGIVGV